MFYRAKAERSCKVWILILEFKNLGSIFQFPKQFVYLKLFGSSHDEKKRFIMKLFKVSSRWFTIRWDSKNNLFTSYLLVLLHFHRWSLAHVADFRTGMPSAENPSQGLLRVSGCLWHLDVMIFLPHSLFDRIGCPGNVASSLANHRIHFVAEIFLFLFNRDFCFWSSKTKEWKF